MSLCTLDLRSANGFDSRILPAAYRAFHLRVLDILIRAQTTLMEAVLAQEMHNRELQWLHAHLAACCTEDNRLGVEILQLCLLGLGVCAQSIDCSTIRRDLSALALDGRPEVGLDHAHSCDAIGGQGLDDLQWCHETIFVDLLEDSVELIACFCQDFWRRCEVGQGGWVQRWLLGTVLAQCANGTLRVIGGGVGAEDIEM